jgi:hypothetical protein
MTIQTCCVFLALMTFGSATSGGQRTVVLDRDTPATEVNRYYSIHAHGPTQKLFTLADERVVVVVSTADGSAKASAMIHVFPEAATMESIDKWINNQHSDALYVDEARPERSIVVPAARFHAVTSEPLDHEVGSGGDEYDRVRIDFTIDAFDDGNVTVKASKGSLDAFVRTKDIRRP